MCGKYWGEIDGWKIYESNLENKQAALERGMKTLIDIALRKLAAERKNKEVVKDERV